MPTTSVDLPEELKERIEKVVEEGSYMSNSELIRDAVRRFLDKRFEKLSKEAIEELNRRLDYNEEDLLTPEELEERVNRQNGG